MLSAVRKNGRMVSPETEASSSTKAEKSIAVMLRPLAGAANRPIQDAHARQPPPCPELKRRRIVDGRRRRPRPHGVVAPAGFHRRGERPWVSALVCDQPPGALRH